MSQLQQWHRPPRLQEAAVAQPAPAAAGPPPLRRRHRRAATRGEQAAAQPASVRKQRAARSSSSRKRRLVPARRARQRWWQVGGQHAALRCAVLQPGSTYARSTTMGWACCCCRLMRVSSVWECLCLTPFNTAAPAAAEDTESMNKEAVSHRLVYVLAFLCSFG